MNLIDPRGLEAREWLDYTGDNLASLVSIMVVSSGDDWREWGSHVRQVLTFRGILIPIPDLFEDWQEWAFRFNQAIAPL